VAEAFRCEAGLAGRALALLARADDGLRASPVPWLCRKLVDTLPFDAWLARAKGTLRGIEDALGGARTDWVGLDPEGQRGDQRAEPGAGQHVARIVQSQHDA
jgi:hypothetical protein